MQIGFIEVKMSDAAKVVLFCLVVMPIAMTLYLWVDPSSSIATRRHLTSAAPIIMATYLSLMLDHPREKDLQRFVLSGTILLAVFMIFAAQMSDDAVRELAWQMNGVTGFPPTSWTITWRGTVFGGHVLTLGLIGAWFWQRPGATRAFLWAIAVAAAAQTFNVIEYSWCNFRAPEISPTDISRSVCVRQTNNPLYLVIPLILVYGVMGQVLAARVSRSR